MLLGSTLRGRTRFWTVNVPEGGPRNEDNPVFWCTCGLSPADRRNRLGQGRWRSWRRRPRRRWVPWRKQLSWRKRLSWRWLLRKRVPWRRPLGRPGLCLGRAIRPALLWLLRRVSVLFGMGTRLLDAGMHTRVLPAGVGTGIRAALVGCRAHPDSGRYPASREEAATLSGSCRRMSVNSGDAS